MRFKMPIWVKRLNKFCLWFSDLCAWFQFLRVFSDVFMCDFLKVLLRLLHCCRFIASPHSGAVAQAFTSLCLHRAARVTWHEDYEEYGMRYFIWKPAAHVFLYLMLGPDACCIRLVLQQTTVSTMARAPITLVVHVADFILQFIDNIFHFCRVFLPQHPHKADSNA